MDKVHPGGLAEIDTLVLAGGAGTRLASVLPDLPKIMAPVAGRPFLDHLLNWLIGQGTRRVVLSLGCRSGAVLEFLQTQSYLPLSIHTAVEPGPLGTAGAIGFAASYLGSDPVMVMNGDTLIDADLQAFLSLHQESGAEASVLCGWTGDATRYGRIEFGAQGRIRRFEEKNPVASPGWVNAGAYLFSRRTLASIAKLERGSLERDFLERLPSGSIYACRIDVDFLDIGMPESLARCAHFLARRKGVSRS